MNFQQVKEKISELKSILENLNYQRESLHQQISNVQQEIFKQNQVLKKMQDEVKEIEISDHALIRYFERVYKLKIDDVKEEILSNGLKEQIKKIKFGKFKQIIGDIKFKLVVKNNVVVTIIDSE